ncbi:MAG: outer membrane lipoprotein carrier protein LolA [Terriglobales bacterium]
MRFLKIFCTFSACLIGICQAADSSPRNVHAISQAVDSHYNHLRSLQAEFTETYHGAGMDRTESGTLLLKKPGKMRWEYRSPKEKLFLDDGKNAWFYLPGERQVRKTPVKKLDDLRSPLSFLLGKTQLEKELRGLSLAPDVAPIKPGDVVLRGIPVRWSDRITQVLLEVAPNHQIVRLVVEEVDGSTTEYALNQQKENIEMTDKNFQFVPPAGTETIQEELSQ